MILEVSIPPPCTTRFPLFSQNSDSVISPPDVDGRWSSLPRPRPNPRDIPRHLVMRNTLAAQTRSSVVASKEITSASVSRARAKQIQRAMAGGRWLKGSWTKLPRIKFGEFIRYYSMSFGGALLACSSKLVRNGGRPVVGALSARKPDLQLNPGSMYNIDDIIEWLNDVEWSFAHFIHWIVYM